VIRDSLIWIFVIQATTRSTPLENRQVFTFEFESVSLQNELDTTLCDKVCQWLAAVWKFSLRTPVSSTNKTDCYYINEILLKVVLNTITHPPFNLLQTLVTHLFQTQIWLSKHGRKHIQWFHQILDR
jgi:hypothetical protein